MHIPEEAPPLNPWPFLIGDAALLATAFVIASDAQTPLSAGSLFAIVACVGLGGILAIIPFLLNHVRRQELGLTERQREISALARSTASSAEQISIAATNLNAISENTARAAKLVESLPLRLQEKINDFKTQLNEVAVTENEALAQEINTLRTSETERLESALTGVRKTAAELASLEAAFRKQIKELQDSANSVSSSGEKSATAFAKAIEAARSESEKAIAAAQRTAVETIQKAVADALSDIEKKFSELSLQTRIPPTQAAALPPIEEPGPLPAAIAEPLTTDSELITAPQAPEPESPQAVAAPVTTPVAEAVIAPSEPAAEDVPSPAIEKPAKKKAPRKPEADNELSLGLDLAEPQAEFSQLAHEPAESAVSADGVTRLLVTAYIGIGNKLHVRGEGPGLSWDRGTPLQFISIGKWRWEAPEADSAVKIKLYKNDEIECTSTGLVSIEPGHQSEITANFA